MPQLIMNMGLAERNGHVGRAWVVGEPKHYHLSYCTRYEKSQTNGGGGEAPASILLVQ